MPLSFASTNPGFYYEIDETSIRMAFVIPKHRVSLTTTYDTMNDICEWWFAEKRQRLFFRIAPGERSIGTIQVSLFSHDISALVHLRLKFGEMVVLVGLEPTTTSL